MGDKWIFLTDQLISYQPDGQPIHYVEMCGPSSVQKPTTTPSGALICGASLAFEQDTGRMFNHDPNTGWRLLMEA